MLKLCFVFAVGNKKKGLIYRKHVEDTQSIGTAKDYTKARHIKLGSKLLIVHITKVKNN